MKFPSFFKRPPKTNVALVLSSGGARGLAHIGAIDSLIEHGYHITSVAGTSFGSIIAGMYASGHLEDYKKWLLTVDKKRVLDLTDFSLSMTSFVKGERIIEEMKSFAPDVNIEDLPIPFCAIATDWKTGKEVVFNKGSMWHAIRASISIPAIFEPVETEDQILIDGGITNPFPLNRVARTKNDLLVGVNVSGPDYKGIYHRKELAKVRQLRNSKALSFLKKLFPKDFRPEFNYYSLIDQTVSISIAHNAQKSILLNPPDILVSIPMKRYGSNDYDKYERISKVGKAQMDKSMKNTRRLYRNCLFTRNQTIFTKD